MPDLTENSNNFPSTFSRASNQFTVVGSTLTEYATDVPAFGDAGLSAQATKTNYLTHSDDLTNAAWTKTNCTAAAGAPTTILGRACTKLTDSGSGGGYAEAVATGTAFAGFSASDAWMATASGTVSVTISAYEGTTLIASETLDVGTTPVRPFTYGFQTFSGSDNRTRITINDASGVIFVNLAGSYIADDQSDEIPTSGSSATRAAANINYSVSGLPSNDVSGSFIIYTGNAEGANSAVSLTPLYVDANNYLSFTISKTNIAITKRVSGVSYSDTGTNPSLAANTEYSVTWSMSSTGGVSVSCNGQAANLANNSSLSGTVVSVYPAGIGGAATQENGQIKNIQVTS